jgi:hypothetical protein
MATFVVLKFDVEGNVGKAEFNWEWELQVAG